MVWECRADIRSITKQVYDVNVDGMILRGRLRRTDIDRIGEVFKKTGVQSNENERRCMKSVVNVCEDRMSCQNKVKWRPVISDYLSCGARV